MDFILCHLRRSWKSENCREGNRIGRFLREPFQGNPLGGTLREEPTGESWGTASGKGRKLQGRKQKEACGFEDYIVQVQPSESDSADTTVLLVTLVPLLLVLGEADPLLAAYTDLHRLFDLVLKKERERERECQRRKWRRQARSTRLAN